MPIKEVDYFYFDSEDAKFLANEMRNLLGLEVKPFVHGSLNPRRPFIIYNGDGYQHHLTREVVRNVDRLRRARRLNPFSYVHIDGHDDIASMYEGDDNSYKSFVLGILKDIDGGVFFLEEGLTGKRNQSPCFLTPIITDKLLDWSAGVYQTRHEAIYLSIDFDVLDTNAGINHLFPQTPIGFDMGRLRWNIEQVCLSNRLIGADLTGFSRNGASPDYINESLNNIARVTEVLTRQLT